MEPWRETIDGSREVHTSKICADFLSLNWICRLNALVGFLGSDRYSYKGHTSNWRAMTPNKAVSVGICYTVYSGIRVNGRKRECGYPSCPNSSPAVRECVRRRGNLRLQSPTTYRERPCSLNPAILLEITHQVSSAPAQHSRDGNISTIPFATISKSGSSRASGI